MNEFFLDTNIFISFLTTDNKEKSKACFLLFKSIENSEIKAVTSIINISEICYVLSSKKIGYMLSHKEIEEKLLPLILLKNLSLSDKNICIEALNIYSSRKNIDFEDAYIVAYLKNTNIRSLYSYDLDFDIFKTIKRYEPS